jgi:TonB family protein
MATLGIVLLIVTLPIAGLRARQAGPAPLIGTIYDAHGGVIPGAEITLVDAQQIRKVARSGSNGRFEFPAIAPGTYVVETRLAGFLPLQHQFELRATGDWNRAITLQLGDVQQRMSIRATRAPASPQQPSAGGPRAPVRVGGAVRSPQRLEEVRPVYPVTMREAGLTGVVPLEAVIGADGSVSSVRVLSALAHPDFAKAAVEAVRNWRFSPTLLNGVPIDVVMNVTIQFDLEG